MFICSQSQYNFNNATIPLYPPLPLLLLRVVPPNCSTRHSTLLHKQIAPLNSWSTISALVFFLFCFLDVSNFTYRVFSSSFPLLSPFPGKCSCDKSWVLLSGAGNGCVCNLTVLDRICLQGCECFLHSITSHALIQNVAGLYHWAEVKLSVVILLQ